MKKEVLIIFKTHLDVGFTDFSETVLQRYLNEFIPNAIRVGNELKGTETPFRWTVGSWLLWLALQNDADGTVEQAINDGILNWHALPFTTHTELMNQKLFEYGVSLSKKLDARFGKQTIGAKMSDVPGHTLGMVPILEKNGVRFLHLGVNPATPLPPVPPIFKWKYKDSEVVLMYQGDYGEAQEFDDFVVYFAHTGDNKGPQSAEAIVEEYDRIRALYPDSTLRAATIDDIAEKVLCLEDLPTIEQEIGDTWIHGAGTDPQKVSRYRKLLRHIKEYDEIPCDITENLLCIPEHTWGCNLNRYFHYDRFYSHTELAAMQAEREKMELSWAEQRRYAEKAETLLGVESDYPFAAPNMEEYTEISLPENIPYEISWQLFDSSDYERYKRDYMRSFVDWAIWDFTKPGLPDGIGCVHVAKPDAAYCKGDVCLYRLSFDRAVTETYGLPYFYLKEEENTVELMWFGKKASRFPQAFWFKFKGMQEDWEVQKMGLWHKPETILGSPLICAVDEGVRNKDVKIDCLDSALVAPFGRRLLQYNCKDAKQDMYFNLYNNIWNTNFPMWYSDDARFRFVVHNIKK